MTMSHSRKASEGVTANFNKTIMYKSPLKKLTKPMIKVKERPLDL